MQEIIKTEDLAKIYQVGTNEIHALRSVDLIINENEYVSLIGPSGSGKSTLMNMLGCLDTPSRGTYLLNNVNVSELEDNELARIRNREIGFVFQTFNLLPRLSALENVALPLYYQKKSRKERQRLAMVELEKMGLTEWAGHLPNQLSGGQKQRVAIARSLITQPKVLLADEPTGALDTQTSYDVLNIIKEVNQKQGITVVLVTHEHDIAAMTQRIVKMKDGVVEQDTPVSPAELNS